jgi:hypothetical protein
LCAYAQHKQEEIGPDMAELVYKIASLYFAEKGSDDHQWKYQYQEAGEHYNSVKAVNYLYKTQKILHNSLRR